MTEYLTLTEVQQVLRYKSKASASRYVKRNQIPYKRRTQAMLIEARAFFNHFNSTGRF